MGIWRKHVHESGEMSVGRKQFCTALLIFLLAACIRFSPFFFGKTLVFGDNYSLQVPQKIWTASWISQGVFPLWNPLLFSGIDWVGDISETPLSPYILPFVLFPGSFALNLLAFSHFVFSAAGMYLFAKKITGNHWWSTVAGGLFASSPIWTAGVNNLPIFQSMSWIPWIFYASAMVPFSVAGAIILALACAGQISAGYPPHLVLTIPTALLFSLVWRKGKKSVTLLWLAAIVLAAGLTAPIIWPFLTTLSLSTRPLLFASQLTTGSLHPAEIVKMLIPNIFDAPIFGMRWGPVWNSAPSAVPYFSWLGTIALALAGWRSLRKKSWVKFAALFSVLGLVFSLGSRLPAYELFSQLPLVGSVRTPTVWLIWTQFFGLLLLAEAGKYVETQKITKAIIGIFATAGISAALGLLLSVFWFEEPWRLADTILGGALSRSAFHTLERDRLIAIIFFGSIIINTILTMLSWRFMAKKLPAIAAIILIIETLLHSQTLLFFGNSQHYASPPKQADFLRDPQFRAITRNANAPYTDFASYWEALAIRPPFSDSFVDGKEMATMDHLRRLRNALTPDWNLAAHVPVVNGYTTLLPNDYQSFWPRTSTEPQVNSLPEIDLNESELARWSVRYYIVDKHFEVREENPFPTIFESNEIAVYELPALARFRYKDGTAAQLTNIRENPNTLAFELTASQSPLVIADRYSPGWKARVNGKDATVENDGGMRAFILEPGNNQVVLFYAPDSYRYGVLATVGTMLFVGTALIVHSRKKVEMSGNEPESEKSSQHHLRV